MPQADYGTWISVQPDRSNLFLVFTRNLRVQHLLDDLQRRAQGQADDVAVVALDALDQDRAHALNAVAACLVGALAGFDVG